MDSKWKAIWNRRRADEAALSGSWQDIFLELKRMNGFDVMDGGIPLDSLLMQAQRIKELLHLTAGMSVFDVGCGAGANLYLLQRDGIAVGGTDYSAALVEAARGVLPGARELTCGEADAFDTTLTYDAALPNSVFSYFPDEAFAERVLTRMLEKATGESASSTCTTRRKRRISSPTAARRSPTTTSATGDSTSSSTAAASSRTSPARTTSESSTPPSRWKDTGIHRSSLTALCIGSKP